MICDRIAHAMMNYLEMVGETDRLYTDFMDVTNGRLFEKAWAKTVYLVGGIKRGIGIAVKIEEVIHGR